MYFKNLENKIVKNVLLPEHVDFLYDIVKNSTSEKYEHISTLGHTTYYSDFSKEFKDYILDIVHQNVDEELTITEMSIARYHTESGFVPKLFPHYDKFNESRITFDVQINSNIVWPIVVEGKEYTLKNNEALIFSGTDQIHWRTRKKLTEKDKVDMLFVHLSRKNNNVLITNEEKEEREKRCLMYRSKVLIPTQALRI
jgi:hypothetical protein